MRRRFIRCGYSDVDYSYEYTSMAPDEERIGIEFKIGFIERAQGAYFVDFRGGHEK